MTNLDDRVFETGETIEIPKYVKETPEGRRVRRLLKVPWKDVDGRINGMISWSEDITERKKIREERDEAFQVITASISYASNIQQSVLPTLDRTLMTVDIGDAAGLVSTMHRIIQQMLSQDTRVHDVDHCSDDGLEMGVCFLPPDKKSLIFAGAGFPLFL